MTNPALASAAVSLLGMLATELATTPDPLAPQPYPPRGKYRTGDLLCPGSDVDAFEQECRAPIFRDAWNHWRLYYTSAHATLPKHVEATVRDYFGKVNASLGGRIRHLSIEVGQPPAWTKYKLVERQQCPTVPMLRASDYSPAYWPVFARFVYRGVESHIPWVALQGSPTPHTCPLEADLLLDAVFAPSQVDVPSAAGDSPLPPHVDPENQGWGALTPDLDLSTQVAIGGLGVLALAVLAGYAVRSFK